MKRCKKKVNTLHLVTYTYNNNQSSTTTIIIVNKILPIVCIFFCILIYYYKNHTANPINLYLFIRFGFHFICSFTSFANQSMTDCFVIIQSNKSVYNYRSIIQSSSSAGRKTSITVLFRVFRVFVC